MNSSWQTFGHDNVKNILSKQLAMEVFPHAYLFAGPEGVGKKTLALEFAQRILGAGHLKQHPDFKLLADSEGQIPVEEVRDFIGGLGYKPFAAKRKVAILDNAQNLNVQSSNALLKTLEEPSESTILILIASGKQLLPTIVSRCQVFNFNAFTAKQLESYAKAKKLKAGPDILALSFGSIGRLENLLKDKESEQKSAQVISRYRSLRGGRTADRLLAVSEFSELETKELESLLEDWYYWQAGNLREDPVGYKASAALGEALAQLKTNKNKKLILQGLFLSI
jgi:DNA polymerase-3 subunit delta'